MEDAKMDTSPPSTSILPNPPDLSNAEGVQSTSNNEKIEAASSSLDTADPIAAVALIDSLCHSLNVTPPHARLAHACVQSLLSTSNSSQDPKYAHTLENHTVWCCVCIWIAGVIIKDQEKLLAPNLNSSVPTLTLILTSTSTTLSSFVKHLPHITTHITSQTAAPLLPPHLSLDQIIKPFTASLLVSISIYKKYEQLFNTIISPLIITSTNSTSNGTTTSAINTMNTLFGSGWLLFICAQIDAASDDMHTQFIYSLCILHYLSLSIISDQNNSLDPPVVASEGDKILRLLSTVNEKVNEETFNAVKKVENEWFDKFIGQMCASGLLLPPPNSPSFFPHSILYHVYLLHNVTRMGAHIDAAHNNALAANSTIGLFTVDLRVFLLDHSGLMEAKFNNPSHNLNSTTTSHRRLFTAPSNNSSSSNIKATDSTLRRYSPAQVDHFSTPVVTPYLRSRTNHHLRTPITRMMESISYLTSTFNHPSPTPSLIALLSSLHIPAQKLSDLITKLNGLSGVELNEEKKRVTSAIYYSVLEKMVVEEKNRLSPAALTNWLKSRIFHSALYSLALEIVLYSYKHTELFPSTLKLFSISYCDYYRLLYTFLPYLPSLPASLIEHMRGIEKRIVEQFGMTKGERIRALVSKEKAIKQLAAELRKDERENEEPKEGNASNQIKDEKGTAADIEITSADYSLLLHYYRTLLLLTRERLDYLCCDLALNLSPPLQIASSYLLSHIYFLHPELLYDRHIDTLILCCLYTIAVKIVKLDWDFKRIIAVYVNRYEGNLESVVKHVSADTEINATLVKSNSNQGEDKSATANSKEEKVNPSDTNKSTDSSKGIEVNKSSSIESSSKTINIIEFYNTIFIHKVKEYAIERLKQLLVSSKDGKVIVNSDAFNPQASSPFPLSPLPRTLRLSSHPIDSPHTLPHYPNIIMSPLKSRLPSNQFKSRLINNTGSGGELGAVSSNGFNSSNYVSLSLGESPRKRLFEINQMIQRSVLVNKNLQSQPKTSPGPSANGATQKSNLHNHHTDHPMSTLLDALVMTSNENNDNISNNNTTGLRAKNGPNKKVYDITDEEEEERLSDEESRSDTDSDNNEGESNNDRSADDDLAHEPSSISASHQRREQIYKTKTGNAQRTGKKLKLT